MVPSSVPSLALLTDADNARARNIIRATFWFCALWLLVGFVAASGFQSAALYGIASIGVVLMACWLLACREIQRGHVRRGVTTFTVSGLALLPVMSLIVPELSHLFATSLFIFLAFGLTYMDVAAAIPIVVLTVVAGWSTLALSTVLNRSSGVPSAFVHSADLTGMLLTLSLDGYLFVVLRRTLESRSQRLLEAELAAGEERNERQLAERSEQIKSEMLSNMSHEIRTPMNAVLAMNDMMLATDLSEAQRDMAETIRNSGEHLLVIINDILDLSRLESGTMALANEQFDVVEVVERALALSASAAASKHLFLGHAIPADVPRRLRGDAGRVTQVLVNLINNAVKFTPAGSVLVSLSCAHGDDRDRVRFEVRDTGRGIAPDDLDRLFQPFSQIRLPGAHALEGSGLGLAICQKLASLMDGNIHVRSVVGSGSTFSFEAPFEVVEDPPADAVVGGPPAPASAAPERTARRVLLVTDRDVVSTSVRAHLERVGPVDLAVTARQGAQAALLAHRADHLLIDAVDGSDAARALAGQLTATARGAGFEVIAGVLGAAPGSLLREVGTTSPVHMTMGAPLRERALVQFLSGEDGAVEERSAVELSIPLPPLRVLLVEDNPVNQKVTTMMLGRLGIAPTVVGNGQEAVAAVQEHPFDLVLMDVQMPVMNGLEASRQIRRLPVPHAARTRIVALTASVLPEQVDACLAAGMDEIVSKPVRLPQLRDLARDAASNSVVDVREHEGTSNH